MSNNRNRNRNRSGRAPRPPHDRAPRPGYDDGPRPPYGTPPSPAYDDQREEWPDEAYDDRPRGPRRPAGARRPQDRRPPADARSQGQREDIRVWWDDHEYVISADVADDVMLMLAMEQGKYLTATTGYLGKQQWEYYVATHSDINGRVSLRELEPFLQEIANQLGNS